MRKNAITVGGVTKEQFQEFEAYAAAFYNNMGNYHSFGGFKFIPEIDSDTFKQILHSNPIAHRENKEADFYNDTIKELYPLIEKEIFTIEKPYKQLGFPHEGSITGYFSRNMNKADLDLVKEFLAAKQIDILNTRAFKDPNTDGHYTITVGSIDMIKPLRDISFKNATFDVEYGEFSSYLEEVNRYIKMALPFAANQNEEEMLEKYMQHFKTGNISIHKDS